MAALPQSSSTIRSSPPLEEQAIFSDEPIPPSSPPSSPPGFPWEAKTTAKTVTQQAHSTKNAFSLLGKRPALSPADDNGRPIKKQAATPKAAAKGKRLSQMQISLGQRTQLKCQTCGMEYVASSEEDRKLHDKYHKQNTEGFDVGKDFLKYRPQRSFFKNFIPDNLSDIESITTVDRSDGIARKRRARGVLDVVQRELGAVEIADEDLWAAGETEFLSKHTCYLYIRGTRCVGFLLGERISHARLVVPPEGRKSEEPGRGVEASQGTALDRLRARKRLLAEPAPTFPIQLGEECSPAVLGISRIWVSPRHRHQNIGMRLLDAAVEHHDQIVADISDGESGAGQGYGPSQSASECKSATSSKRLEGKEMVAFSQPTEMGAALARKWFGRNFGWNVYLN